MRRPWPALGRSPTGGVGEEEYIIAMSAGRKVKKCLTTKETLSEGTETTCIINLT